MTDASSASLSVFGAAMDSPTRWRAALLSDLDPAGADVDEDLSGTAAGTYLLQRRLARGGMGDVYLAAAAASEPAPL
ncbi:MAG TPA: hypothetical protein VK348_14730, partial [Planctomycetota bacterium]|nr:hypothetical protein [Planctomycetota bacterium]